MFQNYNLILHKIIIENVELTMKLSGATKFQRRALAIKNSNDNSSISIESNLSQGTTFTVKLPKAHQ